MDQKLSEQEPAIVVLDPRKLYTTETIVYRAVINQVNMNSPIAFGSDKNGVAYVQDGNHRARRALETGEPLLGQEFARSVALDVQKDRDFRLVAKLKVQK